MIVMYDSSRVEMPGPSLAEIIAGVAAYFDFPYSEIVGHDRSATRVRARQIAFWICRKLTRRSMAEIAQAFDGRDHTTILYGIDQVNRKRDNDPAFAAQLADVTGRVRQATGDRLMTEHDADLILAAQRKMAH